MTDKENRINALLDTIQNYKSLSDSGQEKLKDLYNETIFRFRNQLRYSEIIDGFIADNGVFYIKRNQ